MNGDISRDSYRTSRQYTAVRLQQGRVLSDSDWNEQADIQSHLRNRGLVDTIGAVGAPAAAPGFAVSPVTNGYGQVDLSVSAGRFYVDGVLVENFAESFITEQEFQPVAELPRIDGPYLAYLDVWSRSLSVVEEPSMRDIALNGLDTSTRSQTISQIKLLLLTAGQYDARSSPAEWEQLRDRRSGRLTAQTRADGSTGDPCIIGASGGYSGAENRLYRVEVHRSGPAGVATFKWSRQNAAFVTRWVAQDGDAVTVSSSGRDASLSYRAGQWIELIDEGMELEGRPGTLARIASVQDRVLVLDPNSYEHFDSNITSLTINDFSRGVRRVRPWDLHGPAGAVLIPSDGNAFELEDGLELRFENDPSREFRAGDYWLIPARTVSRNIEWEHDEVSGLPVAVESDGIVHRYARLAFLERTAGGWSVTADARHIFPALGEAVLEYAGGDGQGAMPAGRLAEQLRVRVAAGRHGVPAARVRFTVTSGGGNLEDASNTANTGSSVDVVADAEGYAACIWQNGADLNFTQTAEARLLDDDGNDLGDTVRFSAHRSDAVATDYAAVSGGDLEGEANVQGALDALAAGKVNRSGDIIDGNLEVTGDFIVRGDVIAKDAEHVEGDVNLGNEDGDTLTIAGNVRSGNSSGVVEFADGVRVRSDDIGDVPLRVDAQVQGVAGRAYRVPVNIDNSSHTSPLADYQIILTLDTTTLIAAGKLRSDGGDLLFLDSDESTALPHWIEGGLNTASTRIWLRVPVVAASGSRVVYMYYGNPAAESQSSAAATFVDVHADVIGAYTMKADTGTTLVDLSGTGSDGSINNGASRVAGLFGQALSFDGIDDHVLLPAAASPASVNDFTLSIWARFQSLSASPVLFDMRGLDQSGPALMMRNVAGEIRAAYFLGYSDGQSTEYATPVTSPVGNWAHFVFVRDGALLRAYINGVRLADTFTPASVTPRAESFSMNVQRTLGANSTAGDDFFHGLLEEARVYGTALDDAQVRALYANYGYVTVDRPGFEYVRRFAVTAPNVVPGVEETLPVSERTIIYVQNGSGNVGIGTSSPDEAFTVNGVIHTTAGGIKFPDGTVQTTAGGGSSLISGGANLPLGTIIAWHKNYDGSVPALPDGWAECNGQVCDDEDSPFFGKTLPNLNNPLNAWNAGGSFLRGSTSSGDVQGDEFQGHIHNVYKHAGTHFDPAYPITVSGAHAGSARPQQSQRILEHCRRVFAGWYVVGCV